MWTISVKDVNVDMGRIHGYYFSDIDNLYFAVF